MFNAEKYAKQVAITITLALSGCSVDTPTVLLLPNREDINFKCDVDPYKQGCERMMDYQEHFRSIKKPSI
ncbi:hypothetical protein [Pseudomonas sp. NPDC087029]|uniref:hypothetical protein n=1 Tax=Pseudomonas sp. NPDC087029 TaxID=3364433 RepID=UPI00380F3B40